MPPEPAKNGPKDPEQSSINLPRDRDGNTYLHELCARSGMEGQIRAAMEMLGADINALNSKGLPPLAVAIREQQLLAAEALVSLGAELHIPLPQNKSFNAVVFAISCSRGDIAKMLLEKGGENVVNLPGQGHDAKIENMTPLAAAVYMKSPTLIDKLASLGALPDIESGSDGTTPLMLAAKMNDSPSIEQLAHAGASINRPQSANGMTPLHYAALHQNLSALQKLIDLGADPNAVDKSGQTPLMHAAKEGSMHIVRDLIRAGANVNYKRDTDQCDTALHRAAYRGNPDVVRMLLEAGADPLLTDSFNRTALKCASDTGQINILNQLREAETVAAHRHFEKIYRQHKGP